jgi:hypothetical protein
MYSVTARRPLSALYRIKDGELFMQQFTTALSLFNQCSIRTSYRKLAIQVEIVPESQAHYYWIISILLESLPSNTWTRSSR